MMFTREQIQQAVARGWMEEVALFHWDICKALEAGKTQEAIAEQFNIDDRMVRYIKSKKCPDCGNPVGRPQK